MSPSGGVFRTDILDERKLRIALGESLRKVRKEREMTMVVLGRAAQCSQNFLSKVENGEITPSIPMLQRLARALDIKLSVFLNEDFHRVDEPTDGRRILMKQDP